MNGIFTDLLRSRVAFGWCRKTPGILWTQSSQRQRWPSTRGRLQLHTATSFAAATGGAAGARTSHDSSSKRAFMSTATFSLSFDTRFRPVVGSTRSEKKRSEVCCTCAKGRPPLVRCLGLRVPTLPSFASARCTAASSAVSKLPTVSLLSLPSCSALITACHLLPLTNTPA